MAVSLFVAAYRRLGVARFAWRARAAPLDETRVGVWRFAGVLEPAGRVITAPFTERAAVYARARLIGAPPDGQRPRVLWHKVLTAEARIGEGDRALALDLATAQVLVPREYRLGALRALVADIRIVPRVLARAGYKEAPPVTQWFHLEEEILAPGEAVTVIAERAADGTLRGYAGQPILVSNLNRWRILLRIAWGPALAMLLAFIVLLTGATVVGTYGWLR
jgi:hypothetical protein